MTRLALAVAAAAVLALGLTAAPTRAASPSVKVVIVVGPVDDHNAHYIADADQIAAEARRYTRNVIELVTPRATWSRVQAAAQGASLFIYLGHGNGWPSPYPPFQAGNQDGLGLDPAVGANGTAHVYYGEDDIRSAIRFAPNAVVLLYHLCYASGNSEPGVAPGTVADALARVDNYGAGFIGAGARAVFAEGHPSHPVTDYVRQLFTTNRTMDQVFRSAPTSHHHVLGAFPSQRTPGLAFEVDPESPGADFYRSLVGDLRLRAGVVRAAPPAATDHAPARVTAPGGAQTTARAGTPLFASASAAATASSRRTATLPAGTRLRVTRIAAPAKGGHGLLAVTVLGRHLSGFVRASDVAPADSAPTVLWSLDHSGGWLSPDGNGAGDALVVAARLSEVATASLTVRNRQGAVVWSSSQSGDIVRFAWNLRTRAGRRLPDGPYTWTLRAHDGWGNGGVTRAGSFTIDSTPPVTRAASASTSGHNGWSTSPVSVTLHAADRGSGVSSTEWRLGSGAAVRYTRPPELRADGVWTFGYRSTDRAAVREPWRTLTIRIDRTPPVLAVAIAGTRSPLAGTWRGPVTLTPAASDATSGVAARSAAVDGAPPVALRAAALVVRADGPHTVTFGAVDKAGNRATTTVAFRIDATPPVVTLPAPSTPSLTVTPNGDRVTDTVTLPYSVSEPGTLSAQVLDPDGSTVVRTYAARATRGGAITWDGRDGAGRTVPDGRYTIRLTPTDLAGNTGKPVSRPVDVFSALASVAASPTLFYPQDGDALADRSTVSFRLLTPAAVSITVVDASGATVRGGTNAKPYAAGSWSWRWDGKSDDGSFVPPGVYRILVTATNGVQSATRTLAVDAEAFRMAVSMATARRGSAFTLTAVSAEHLSTAPIVSIRQPGLAAWSVTMHRVSATTWRASIRPRPGGTPGQLTLAVRAHDARGGLNTGSLALELR